MSRIICAMQHIRISRNEFVLFMTGGQLRLLDLFILRPSNCHRLAHGFVRLQMTKGESIPSRETDGFAPATFAGRLYNVFSPSSLQ